MAAIQRATSTRYDHPYRPRLIRWANGASELASRLGWHGVDLTEPSLLEAAARSTGLQDFGDESFLPRLRLLLRGLQTEAQLHPVGRFMARVNLIRILSNRLRMEAIHRRHPDIAERPCPAPIYVVGLQRTGTTLLHRMLACDPGLRVLRSWEAINPAPLVPPRETGADPRIFQAELAELGLSYLAPDFFAIHPVQAHAPEEDCLLFDYGFWSTVPEATQRVPSFAAWLEQQDHRPAYAEYARVLRLLSWQRGPNRWLNKTPQHLAHLDALLHTFPDARIIQTHRDPGRVLASFASMMAHSRGVFSDVVDAPEVARHWLAKAEMMIERSRVVREGASAETDTFADVRYADLVADPEGELRRVYRWLERPLTPELLGRVACWRTNNPQHKYGRHRYRLEDFDLDPESLRLRFADYCERHAIPEEAVAPSEAN